MFDLYLSPLFLSAGRELAELPGLISASAPRRVDRHRSGDLLVALLGLSSAGDGKLLADAEQTLTHAYFSTGGTVTSALRAAAEKLNDLLISRGAFQSVLNLAVIHGGLLYLAHAGPVHTFVLNRGAARQFTDPQNAARLGAAQDLSLRFFQAAIEPGDLLILTANPPAAWEPTALSSTPAPNLDLLRRRLISLSAADLRAGLVQIQEGSGQIHRLQPHPETPARPAQPFIPTPDPAPAAPRQIPAAAPAPQPDASPSEPALIAGPDPALAPRPIAPRPQPVAPSPQPDPAPELILPPTEAPLATTNTGRIDRRTLSARQAAQRPGLFARLAAALRRPSPAAAPSSRVLPALDDVPAPPPPRPTNRPWMRRLAAVLRGSRAAQNNVERGLGDFLPRLLPGASNQPHSISPGTMFFFAIAVPVIIVAVATTVYLRSGASEQRLAFMQQAVTYAEQARAENDLALRHSAWTQSMYWIKKAEEYGQDDESRALRYRAQTALDSIDGIVRLSLAPAFSGILTSDLNITRVVATDGELYLLDSTQGRVLRLLLVGGDYELDPGFSCGPGPSGGGKIIGSLVGLAALPITNEHSASVVAIDGVGNLLYCIPGEPPLSANLSPPENNWGRITGMTLQNGDLFVLDPMNNGVQRYDGVNYGFGDRPRLFFGNQIPNLSQTIDLANYQDDLYLLNSDGTLTLCTYSEFESAPTRCLEPAHYADSRTAGEFESFPDTRFLSLQTTQPPDPSLYILDASGPALYHFSLRLNLQRQFRQDPASDFPLPQKAVTAFTIAPNRTVFMAFGNQVYYGALP